MIKITMKHHAALSQAEMFISPAVKQNMEPRHRSAVEKMLELIAETKMYILQELYTPRLPIETDGRC